LRPFRHSSVAKKPRFLPRPTPETDASTHPHDFIFVGKSRRSSAEPGGLNVDVAVFYDVETRALVQAVKRNEDRFPPDFMFQHTEEEFANLRSQSVMSSSWGGRRHLPYAFTEHGVAMLSGVLKSRRAVLVSVAIVRTFVHLRQLLSSNRSLALRLDALEKKYDRHFRVVFEAIRELMEPPPKPTKKIGFRHE